MSPVSLRQRAVYALVWALAIWVGIWGYFIPQRIDFVIPWSVPPLHARFIGAVYLSGAAAMTGAMLARRWSLIRVVVPMIGIWTGGLLVVSFFYLGDFDFSSMKTWIWWVAYVTYPLAAFWIAWRLREDAGHAEGAPIPVWLRRYLTIQGGALAALALVMLLLPDVAVAIWPWAITPLLAQLYSAPLLSYGLGSLYAARQVGFPEVRLLLITLATFATLVGIASVLHIGLFSANDSSDWIWFATLIAVSVTCGGCVARDLLQARRRA